MGEYIKEDVDAYNKYIIAGQRERLTDDFILDLVVKELILASSYEVTSLTRKMRHLMDKLPNLVSEYLCMSNGTHRHIKTHPDYELNRLVRSIIMKSCKGKNVNEEFNSLDFDILTYRDEINSREPS
jgi:hypothetical protein